MKRLTAIALMLAMAFSAILCVGAEGANVIYSGDAGEFIFEPGSEYSPTDLFPNYKGVMPGDSLTQEVTVRNDASNKVKVKIYMRSLGAHDDEMSVKFLSGLHLRVEKSAENEMAYMFDAAANESAQLTDWVELGTLYSGGVVNLNVILDVPVELDNEYSSQIGYLDWEFKVEEFPIEPDDPEPPFTGDTEQLALWIGTFAGAFVLLFILIVVWRRKKKQDEEGAFDQSPKV